jgi:hypothetical protein
MRVLSIAKNAGYAGPCKLVDPCNCLRVTNGDSFERPGAYRLEAAMKKFGKNSKEDL